MIKSSRQIHTKTANYLQRLVKLRFAQCLWKTASLWCYKHSWQIRIGWTISQRQKQRNRNKN